MSYATVQDAIDRYGEDYVVTSADRDNDGVLDTDAFQLALDDATNEINGYLVGKNVALPLSPVPLNIKRYCIDMAIYIACPTADVSTENKTKRYNDAVKFLTLVSTGKVRLVADDAAPEALPMPVRSPSIDTNTVIPLEIDDCSRAFSRTNLRRI